MVPGKFCLTPNFGPIVQKFSKILLNSVRFETHIEICITHIEICITTQIEAKTM